MSIIEKAVGKLEKEAGFGAKKSLDNAKPHLNQEKVVPADNQMQAAVHIEESKPAISVKTSIDATRSNYIDIDLNRLYQLGIVTPNQGKTQVAEQFRIIKRPILTKALKQRTENGKHGNLIMISSALAAEGKSFCALSLAMSIASEMDNRVLLVDADVARPSIPRILGFGVKKGLLDILLDEQLDIADVLNKTSVEKLSIITAGAPHPHATELLASQSMEKTLDELAQRYNDRIIIFDSPPLLLTSEAHVLAARMGQIILVVEAERTAQQELKLALSQIESCENISLIYNKDRALSHSEYYGYYYS